MSLDAIYADGIDSDLERWAANPGPAPAVGFSATSFLGSGLKGAPAAALETAGSVADVLSGFAAPAAASGGVGMFSLPNEEQKKQEAKAREQMLQGGFDVGAGNVLRRKAEEFGPDPLTTHTADQVIFGLTRFGTKAVAAVGTMGPAGALVLGADEANTATQRLRAQGIDDATAAKVGAVQGVISAAGAVMPMGGRTILETLGLVAAGGPGSYMVQEKLSKDILQRAGYADEASLHNPFDPLGLALSTIIPAGFGAWHMRGVRATKLQDVVQHIESGGRRFGADGQILTSPKGAQGEMQVMPGTAKDPGFGVAPAKDDSPEELARVGRDYLGAMVNRYGNQDQALAAYNAGPGAVDAAIKAHGENWLAKLPKETQDYVAKARKLTGDYAATEGAADPAVVDAARVTTLNDTVARSLPDTPDAHAQVMRAADIIGERSGRAAEQEIAPVRDIDLPQFREWFGDSKVVDQAGEPMVVYHARQTGNDFDAFRTDRPVFVSSTEKGARMGAVASGELELMPLYVRAHTPANTPETPVHFLNVSKTFRENPKSDSVYVDDEASQSGAVSLALRSPEQAKSAVGNSGKFDATSASLTDPLKPGERSPREENNSLPSADSVSIAGDTSAQRTPELGTRPIRTESPPTARDPQVVQRDIELATKRRSNIEALLECLQGS